MSESASLINKNTSNNLLRRDVRFLGHILGEMLVHQGGNELFTIVEKIREMSKSLRAQYSPEMYAELKNTMNGLAPEIRYQVIRAFAIYFQLVNIAEQNHRIRRKRDYERTAGESVQPGSIEDSIRELKNLGISFAEVQEMIQGISLELVMTAHPTEATRRAVLDIHKRIANDVMELDNPNLTFREREQLREKLLGEVITLWQTDELRDRKPTVIDEVKYGLYYFDETLFDVLPQVYQELERCLHKYYPEESWYVPTFLKFGSWIGGDRDGNPSVTSKITWQTLTMHRNLVLKKYEEQLTGLMRHMSFSKNIVEVTKELLDSIEKDRSNVILPPDVVWRNEKEPYRIKVKYMIQKIRNTADPNVGEGQKYNNPSEFMEDLLVIERSLRNHYADFIADTYVRTIIRQVELFGFHLVTLDIRQHSKEHESAMTEILAKMSICPDYGALTEEQKKSSC